MQRYNLGMIARDEVWIEPEPDKGYYLVIEAGRMHIPQKTLWDCADEQADALRLWMRNGCVIRMDGIWTCRGKDENVCNFLLMIPIEELKHGWLLWWGLQADENDT